MAYEDSLRTFQDAISELKAAVGDSKLPPDIADNPARQARQVVRMAETCQIDSLVPALLVWGESGSHQFFRRIFSAVESLEQAKVISEMSAEGSLRAMGKAMNELDASLIDVVRDALIEKCKCKQW